MYKGKVTRKLLSETKRHCDLLNQNWLNIDNFLWFKIITVFSETQKRKRNTVETCKSSIFETENYRREVEQRVHNFFLDPQASSEHYILFPRERSWWFLIKTFFLPYLWSQHWIDNKLQWKLLLDESSNCRIVLKVTLVLFQLSYVCGLTVLIMYQQMFPGKGQIINTVHFIHLVSHSLLFQMTLEIKKPFLA